MELLTMKELCAALKVREASIYHWRKKGMPVALKGEGKQGVTRFYQKDVINWLNERGRNSVD